MRNMIVLVTVRIGSIRFSGKSIADILGKLMIGLLYERLAQIEPLTNTTNATLGWENTEIGVEVAMSSDKHERTSDKYAV